MLLVSLIAVSCSDIFTIGQQLQDFEDRLTNLEGSAITSIEGQIVGISASIDSLKAVDVEIYGYIAELERMRQELEKRISSFEGIADSVNGLESELATVNTAVQDLKVADASLDKKIEDLKSYVDDNLKSNQDWANSTFSTLAQYDSLQTEIATLKLALQNLEENLEANAAESAANLATAISACESSMKTWVNEQMAESYYDITAIDAKLAALEKAYKDADTSLKEKIEAQQEALEKAKAELTNEYQKAISDAIENNNGVLDSKIANVVKTAQETLQKQIDDICGVVEALEERLTVLESKLVSRIQSLIYVPEYSDGKVVVAEADGVFGLRFLVTPVNLASSIETLWETDHKALKAALCYSKNPATRSSSVEMIPLNVTSVSATAEGLLNLMISVDEEHPLSEDFWDGEVPALVYIHISDGNNDRASDMIVLEGRRGSLFPDHIELPIPGPGTPSEGVSRTANCYIISEAGSYTLKTVKGNSSVSVGAVSSAEVLWESFGTDETPKVGDLISSVSYFNGRIGFTTAERFHEGNAVIAAKDASGNILWSWHIWMTDNPKEQVYYNGAGTMMDRNLGATSATPGDVGALGLLYQWGRKDPFLGSSSISSFVKAESTYMWPDDVSSDSNTGTIEYATANPTTFIGFNGDNYDWYYTGSELTDDTRWTESSTTKSIYDPCPVGWRVPDGGGSHGVWSTALGSDSSFSGYIYDSSNIGMDFSGKFGSASTIWYPALARSGIVEVDGEYWSVSSGLYGSFLLFREDGTGCPSTYTGRFWDKPVRCLKEGSRHGNSGGSGTGGDSGGGSGTGGSINMGAAEDMSADLETANSYIVTKSGSYKFKAYKGNSKELAGSPSSVDPVGAIAKVEVLWESFGTSETPAVGDLIKDVAYEYPYIGFITADNFHEGNAVIAAKDASDNILWSWHIWMTDYPQSQVYYNGAGVMMDRNLGATSATPGDVGALGLLYQWGRKDPFLASSSISVAEDAASTLSWPFPVESDVSTGTVGYAAANPTTYIVSFDNWQYENDAALWSAKKTIYDPCPTGWLVPEGGDDGVWVTASGMKNMNNHNSFDTSKWGFEFSGVLGESQSIWYPVVFPRVSYSGNLVDWADGGSGIHKFDRINNWASDKRNNETTSLWGYSSYVSFNNTGDVSSYGYSVRCVKEGSSSHTPPTSSPSSWFLVGNFNGWLAADPTYEMTKEGDWYVFKDFEADGGGVKFVADAKWSVYRGGTFVEAGAAIKVTQNGSDMQVAAGTYDVYLSADATTVYFKTSDNVVSVYINYIDEYGINHGQGVKIGETVWAPVNCGYHETDYQWGKLYQWGRKYGQGYSGSLYNGYTNIGMVSDVTTPEFSEGGVSLRFGQSDKFSNTFFTCQDSPYDWLSPQDGTLWNAGTEGSPVKTDADPCPDGWRVPTYTELSKLSQNYSSWTKNNANQPGLWFSGASSCTEEVPQVFFPAASCRDYFNGDASYRGSYGYYWSSSFRDDYAYSLYFYQGKAYVSNGGRASGYSIRCVQDK